MRKLILLFIAFVALTTSGFANDKVSFEASGPDVVVAGERFRISYKINTQKIKDFRAPSMKGLEVLMGPSRSSFSNTQIVNGSMTSEKGVTFTFVLLANDPGDYTIPGATIVADGDQMISNAMKVKVLPQESASAGGSAQQSSSASRSSSGSQSISNQDVFITATATKTKVYEQEAFMLTYKIFTREPRMSLENVKLPDFTGFQIGRAHV